MNARAKNNIGTALMSGASTATINRGKQLAADYHWYPEKEFGEHLTLVDWDDTEDHDEDGRALFRKNQIFIRYGNLARIHFRAPSTGEQNQRHPRRQKDTTITFTISAARESHLVFDPDSADDQLYMKIKRTARAPLAERFWTQNKVRPRYLSEWAMIAGGRHARDHYPKLEAKPVGVMTAVVYFTLKKDDGPKPSFYIHKLGEVSCFYPILTCDEEGRLWICGGNYANRTAGVTD